MGDYGEYGNGYVERFDQRAARVRCTPGPDQRPSSSRKEIVEDGNSLLFVLEVKGLGAVMLRATSDHADASGRMSYNSLAASTQDGMQFD